VVVVRDGEVYGSTDITVYKLDKIQNRENIFAYDLGAVTEENVQEFRARIAEEKTFFDGLSEKEKKQLSSSYVERLNQLVEWLASCEYNVGEGVQMEQGGLAVSGDELTANSDISFTLTVTKKESWKDNDKGVQNGKDFVHHKMKDTAGNRVIQQYYEISLTKTVDGIEHIITDVLKNTDATGTFRITMEIPEEFRGYKNYSILHVHNGETVMLTDLDDDPNTITFEVNKFSTFALTATDMELSVIPEEEPVCEHSYPAGKDKCTLCGHYRDGIASLYGYSISLNGDISINFYFDVTEETRNDADAYILITYPNGTTEKILLSEARTKTAGNVTYYIVNPELPAKEINSIISARVVLGDGTEGILYEKSIRGYAETVIANAASFSQKQVSLMEALIAYGEAASVHFGGQSAAHEMSEITAETLKAYEIQKIGSTNAGLSYYGSSVLLESETTIRHYFKLTSGSISDHTFLLDGKVVTPVNEAGTNYWYIDIPNIVSKDLDRVYVLEADGMTVKYCALSYAYAALNAYGNDASKGAICNTVRALYEYNRAANEYFEQ
jgi:hypothetical protein